MKRVIAAVLLLLCSLVAIVFNLKKDNQRALPIIGEYSVNSMNDTLFYKVPEPRLIASGITSKEFKNQEISIVNFFFTKCPSICPITTFHFKKVNDTFLNQKQVFINSVSVDNLNDTKQVLNQYKKDQSIESDNWIFYTGSKKEIYEFAKNCKIKAFQNANVNEIIHEPVVVLLDKEKRIRGFYNSTKLDDINNLIRDTQNLIKEQS
jgi:protein SCO1